MDKIIISLGGSIIVPNDVNVEFLKKFRQFVLRHMENGNRFFIIAGGGGVTRHYQKAASQIIDLNDEDVDWLGIHCTRLNAHLIRTIFYDIAHPRIIKDPTESLAEIKEPVVVASGWKPGWSTDYDAVLLAKNLEVNTVINLSNITHVYEKDPNQHKDAKTIERISWKDYRKIIGDKWKPGLNVPFDPVASREAEKLGLKVVTMNGLDLENLDKFLNGEKFEGSIIE